MPKASKSRKQWNDKVEAKVEVLDPLKEWLDDIVKSETDWGTQKSAHQAMRFLEKTPHLLCCRLGGPLRILQGWHGKGRDRANECCWSHIA